MKTRISDLAKDNHPSRPAFASCIQSYLMSLSTQVSFSNPKFPEHLCSLVVLQEAIEEQSLIGCHNLLRRYLSTKWKLRAAAEIAISQTHRSLQSLFNVTRERWLARNDVLHRGKEKIDTKYIQSNPLSSDTSMQTPIFFRTPINITPKSPSKDYSEAAPQPK